MSWALHLELLTRNVVGPLQQSHEGILSVDDFGIKIGGAFARRPGWASAGQEAAIEFFPNSSLPQISGFQTGSASLIESVFPIFSGFALDMWCESPCSGAHAAAHVKRIREGRFGIN